MVHFSYDFGLPAFCGDSDPGLSTDNTEIVTCEICLEELGKKPQSDFGPTNGMTLKSALGMALFLSPLLWLLIRAMFHTH